MLKQKGFSMVELMIVIVIVAILSSVAIPMMRGRIERAKYTEGMAGCAAIATAVRAYIAENVDQTIAQPTMQQMGFKDDDLKGKYFNKDDYTFSSFSYDETSGALIYTIQAKPNAKSKLTENLTLNQDGVFKIGNTEL